MDTVTTWLADLPSSGPITFAFGQFADDDGDAQDAIVRQLLWDAVGRVSPEIVARLLPVSVMRERFFSDDYVKWSKSYLRTTWACMVAPLGLSKAPDVQAMLFDDVFHSWGRVGIAFESGLTPPSRILVNPLSVYDILEGLSPYSPDLNDFVAVSAWLDGWGVRHGHGVIDLTDAGLGRGLTWDPLTETRSVAERRLRDELRMRLRLALDGIEEDHEQSPIADPTEKRAIEHFDWLIRYQLRDESIAAIANSVFRSRQAVSDAIRSTASLIGIELRPTSTGGRPRKHAG